MPSGDRMAFSPADFIGAEGDGIISFGSGQPDLPPPKEVYSCLPTYSAFKYGPIAGLPKLRAALAEENNAPGGAASRGAAGVGRGFTQDNFVITNGASEALDLVLRAVGKPGGKILLHAPYYYSYKPLVEMNHLTPVFVGTTKGKINMEEFHKAVHDVDAVLINSPSNPTGRVQDVKDLREIERATADLGLPLISDEVYKDLIYERENYNLSGPHVVTVNSFSKTFAMCGFRVGYLFSNNVSIVQRCIGLKTHTSMNTNILGQEMAWHALRVPRSYVDEQVAVWKARRDAIYDGMVGLGLDVWKPEGAFYILPKIQDSLRFSWELWQQHQVITYPGDWFGAPGRVRFSYALDVEKIDEGLARVGKALEGWRRA